MNCLICGQQHDTTICPDKPIPASPNLFCPCCGYALDGLLEPRLGEAEEEILRLSVLATCHSDERIAAEAETARLRELLREALEACGPIIDSHNITSAEEYVVVSLLPKEWRAIRALLARLDAYLREPGGPR